MFRRNLSEEALQVAAEFKIACVIGPRQAGKTTLCQTVFKRKPYVNLENPDIALHAMEHPRAFLAKYPKGAILDEAQRVPHLFNYLQEIVDKRKKNDQFILSGSNNFLMQESITQSLAGRVGYVHLLPFSLNEFLNNKKSLRHHEEHILQGFYPSVVSEKSSANRWYENYIQTYVERDVRQLKNIENSLLFNRFLKLCASRAGQLINLTSLSKEAAVDSKTVSSWLALLESSYIIFRLPPFHTNFDKRVTKTPKLYFYDTGLLCYLLGLKSRSALKKYRNYGAVFENMIVAELKKNRFNKDQSGELFFFRDHVGNETDIVIQRENELIPIEIKSSEKLKTESMAGLKWFNRTFRQRGGILLYTGRKEGELQDEINLVNWKRVVDL